MLLSIRTNFCKLFLQCFFSLHCFFCCSRKQVLCVLEIHKRAGLTEHSSLSCIREQIEINIDKFIRSKYEKDKSRHMLQNIPEIFNHCADTESYHIVQVQFSQIVLYHLKEKGFDREALRSGDVCGD